MPDAARSALSSLWEDQGCAQFSTGTVVLQEAVGDRKLILRGESTVDFARNVEACLGSPLPLTTDTPAGEDPCCILISDREWLVASNSRPHLDRELAAVLQGFNATVFSADSAWIKVTLDGNGSRTLLAQGCNQDFHPSQFRAGQFCASQIARIPVFIFHGQADNKFDLYVDRSLAMDLWLWLRDTAREMTQ